MLVIKIKKFISLIVTGSHLSKKFGNTIEEIKKDKIKNIYKINLSYDTKNIDKTNNYISTLVNKSDQILKKLDLIFSYFR